MAAVPQNVLTWLYRVVSNKQYGPQIYNDVANLLAQYPGFSPRTDVYTHEDGSSALLLQLSGTLPVNFRGAVYRFPLTIWIPNAYPREPPMVYVTPTQDMVVRPGQHVSVEGKVYHHYLAHWTEAWDRSTTVDLMSILRDVFAKEPPVISKQQQNMRPMPPPQQRATPPAVPPLPPELARPSPPPPPSARQGEQTPPKLPPKPGQVATEPEQEAASVNGRYTQPPPLPPLPNNFNATQSQQQQTRPGQSDVRSSQYVPQSQDYARQYSQHPQPAPVPPKEAYPQEALAGPVSPIYQNMRPASFHQPQYPSYQHAQQPLQSGQAAFPPSQPIQPQAQPFRPGPYEHPAHQQPLQPEPPRNKPDTPDLLTSPFDLELPASASGIAPPIPPNPEKDALLRSLSQSLTQTLHSNLSQTNSGMQALRSQSKALHAALATLQSEITNLNTLHANIKSNTSILQQSLHRADAVIADAKTRISAPPPPSSSTGDSSTAGPGAGKPATGLPAIDDVLVAPTVVGKQLYDLVAEERGIQRAIYALQAGLVKGRVGVETWTRLTRGLAREAFLKRALVRKAARGMGLVLE